MPYRKPLVGSAVVLICFWILAAQSSSAQGFQPISPEELKMTSEPLAPGAPAIILFRQVDRDDNGSTSHETNYLRIKILTEEGRKYANIEIPFVKEQRNVVNVHGRTIKPDGSIVNYEGKIFEQTIAKAKGLKYLAKTFTLPDVQVGSIIEYFYTYDLAENYIFDSHWILSDELFTRKAKFSLKPYSSFYSNFTVSWTWQALPPGTSQPKEGADHIIRLEASKIPAFHTEDFMPPENELKSRVDFVYRDELPEKDPDKYWQKVTKKLNGEVEHFIGKKKPMEQAVAQIVSPSDSPEAKMQKIYARVQQLRNTSYEVEKTEQERKREKEKAADNVEDVWKRGYGNGVQLTWLYLALVRAAGFEAHGVMISERSQYFFHPGSMDRYKLDSNVVQVKLNGKEIYCDPGSAFTPFGLLPWPETSVLGRLLDSNGGAWVHTTLPEANESRIERSAKMKLTEIGDLEGKLTVTYSGLEAVRRRVEERNEDDTDKKKYLEDEVKDYIAAASELELTNRPDWRSSTQPLVAEFSLKVPGWASSAGRRALVSVGLFSAAEKHLFDHTDRVHPIYFEYPFEKIDDVTVELPSGWQVSSVPPAKNQEGRVVSYSLSVENGRNTVHLHRKLSVDVLLLETKYYPALRNFFQMVRTGDEEQVVLQPGTAVATQ